MYTQLGDFPTSRNSTTQTGDFLVHNSSLPARLFLLGFFDDDAFIGVTHTLALVRLGFAICADFSSHLTNDLLVGALDDDLGLSGARSAERTSELQSLMRISYAVFCLKKKPMIKSKK